MSLANLSIEYERMRFELSRAKLDREHLFEWLNKMDDDIKFLRDEVAERLRTLTHLALEAHTVNVKATDVTMQPHWTEEQRAALCKGIADRKYAQQLRRLWAEEGNVGCGPAIFRHRNLGDANAS